MKQKKYLFIFIIITLFLPLITFTQEPPLPPSSGNIQEVSFKLYRGWNQISSPRGTIQKKDIKDCEIDYIYRYEYSDYLVAQEIKQMTGYWVLVRNDCQLKAKVSLPEIVLISLSEGWNLISASGSWNEIKNNCELESPIYHWDAQEKKYNQFSTDIPLKGDYGYWVKVKNNCILDQENVLGRESSNLNDRSCSVSVGDNINNWTFEVKIALHNINDEQVKEVKGTCNPTNKITIDKNTYTAPYRGGLISKDKRKVKLCDDGICYAKCGMIPNLVEQALKTPTATAAIKAQVVLDDGSKISCPIVTASIKKGTTPYLKKIK